MLDLKRMRTDEVFYRNGLEKREAGQLWFKVQGADAAWRQALMETQKLQESRNKLAKSLGSLKENGEIIPQDLLQKASELRDQFHQSQKTEAECKERLDELMANLPNIPAEDVPVGPDSSGNHLLKTCGQKPIFSFAPKTHDVLGKNLNQMDFESASRMSGSRFVVLKGPLARLERALANFMLDVHTQYGRYMEVSPPYLVRESAVFGVGQLPKFAQDLFVTTDGRWLIPTAEVSLTNLVQEQILDLSSLPLRYVAYTPCFRSEAGAAGKDTHGMIRLHQFSKVELVHVTIPEQSEDEYEFMCRSAESILEYLGLSYRVVLLCTGDMGFASRRTQDIEVWFPGQNAYREIASCSHFGDFQARRLLARYRDESQRINYVHTLNSSGLPIGRTLAAILENYQQEDGSVRIPKALCSYMGGDEKIAKI